MCYIRLQFLDARLDGGMTIRRKNEQSQEVEQTLTNDGFPFLFCRKRKTTACSDCTVHE